MERAELVEEEDSDLVKKIMGDVDHYNTYVGLLKERD